MNIELLRVVGRHPVECLADVGPHVGAVDVGDVQHGRGHETGCNNGIFQPTIYTVSTQYLHYLPLLLGPSMTAQPSLLLQVTVGRGSPEVAQVSCRFSRSRSITGRAPPTPLHHGRYGNDIW